MYHSSLNNQEYSNAVEPMQLVQMSKCSWYVENERKWAHIYNYDNWFIVEVYIMFPNNELPTQKTFRTLSEAAKYVGCAIG